MSIFKQRCLFSLFFCLFGLHGAGYRAIYNFVAKPDDPILPSSKHKNTRPAYRRGAQTAIFYKSRLRKSFNLKT